MSQTPQRRGLRILIGLAGFFSVFGLAWKWQDYTIAESHEMRNFAPDILSSQATLQPDEEEESHLAPGWGRILLGRPSGAEPSPRPEPIPSAERPGELEPPPTETDPVAPGPENPAPLTTPKWPADQELKVRAGQSLSKIIAQAYGRSTPELVERLAAYNGMENANKLREGQQIRIPVLEKLNEFAP